jgi:hypothetical protein
MFVVYFTSSLCGCVVPQPCVLITHIVGRSNRGTQLHTEETHQPQFASATIPEPNFSAHTNENWIGFDTEAAILQPFSIQRQSTTPPTPSRPLDNPPFVNSIKPQSCLTRVSGTPAQGPTARAPAPGTFDPLNISRDTTEKEEMRQREQNEEEEGFWTMDYMGCIRAIEEIWTMGMLC